MKKKLVLAITILVIIIGGILFTVKQQIKTSKRNEENSLPNSINLASNSLADGESNTSKESKTDKYGYKNLSELPQDYSLEQAIDDGCVVITYNKVWNKDKLDSFIENTAINSKDRKEDKIRIVQFTVEGDLIIKDLEYKKEERLDGCLEMDKTGYILTVDNTRDKFSADEDRKITVDDDIPAVFYGIIKEEKDDDIHIVLALYAEIDYVSNANVYKEIEVCSYQRKLEIKNSDTMQN